MEYDELITYYLTRIREAHREISRGERVEHNKMQVKTLTGMIKREMESVGSVGESIDGINLDIIDDRLRIE